MKQKQFARKGASLKALKNMKGALKQAQQEKEEERKKALLCALQRDFYREAIVYFEEYILGVPKTMEQVMRAKQYYRDFIKRRGGEYATGARAFVLQLYPERANTPGAWEIYAPYANLLQTLKACKKR